MGLVPDKPSWEKDINVECIGQVQGSCIHVLRTMFFLGIWSAAITLANIKWAKNTGITTMLEHKTEW